MITTIRPLSERVKDIHLVDDGDTGLVNNVAAAARNRANIERMRKQPQVHHAAGGQRSPSLLDKPNEIKQEEIKPMETKVEKPVIPPQPLPANHKGEWCDKAGYTCQEGYCDECEIGKNKK